MDPNTSKSPLITTGCVDSVLYTPEIIFIGVIILFATNSSPTNKESETKVPSGSKVKSKEAFDDTVPSSVMLVTVPDKIIPQPLFCT